MIVKLAFRYFLAVAAWYRDSIQVSTQIDYIKQSGAAWELTIPPSNTRDWQPRVEILLGVCVAGC
jgi:hypothetical protein